MADFGGAADLRGAADLPGLPDRASRSAEADEALIEHDAIAN